MQKTAIATQIKTGIYLPEKVLTNEELEKRNIVMPSGKLLRADRILEKIGVERRHIARDDQTAADLSFGAVGELVKEISDNELSDTKLVLASTSHPVPFHLAGSIKEKLGLHESRVMDFHAACSGSAMMFGYLHAGGDKYLNKRVILAAADKFSNTLVDLRRSDAMELDSSLGQTIFGDGAAAISFVYGVDLNVLSSQDKPLPDPSGGTNLIYMGVGENKFVEPCIVKPVACSPGHRDFPNGYFTQNGPRVFESVYKNVPQVIRETVGMAGLKSSDIDLVVIHPGSRRVVDALRGSLEPDFEVYSEYKDGNMSSVSMLYSFVKALRDKKIGRGSRVVLCGFGAGSPHLYSSTAVVELL